MDAAVKRGFLKKVTSNIGSAECSSWTANRVRSTAAAAKQPRMTPSVHPRPGASMRPKTSVTSPAIDRTAPSGSSLGADGSLERGSRIAPAPIATTAIGMLTVNTACQLKCSTR